MNISPQKFQQLTDQIRVLEIQVAGLLAVTSATQARDRDRDPSIAGFCARHGFSIGTYKNLRKRGKGPVETRVSANRITITEEDEAAWIAARQADARERQRQRAG